MNYLDVFDALKATRSRNEKIEILGQADKDALDILYYTYNPFKHYFINKIPKYNAIADMGLQSLEERDYRQILFELSIRELTGDHAIEQVKIFLKGLNKRDAEIFKNILKKDQRCGIGTSTINKAIPGLIPEFGAMLAKKWDPSRYTSNLMMSIKFDGVRAIFKEGSLFTRNGHKILGVEHITDLSPPSWSLDGELLIEGMHFQESSGLIRSDDPTPQAVYYVFDIPESTMTFFKRYSLYSDCISKVASPFINTVKHVFVKNLDHINKTFQDILTAGYEGLVIKPKDHKYKTSRSWDWMKLKAEHSEDLPVVDEFQGDGKYVGMLGGFIVERKNGVLVRVGSGFSDAERTKYWNNLKTYKGKLIKVTYHEITLDGSLRHPTFKGFRWDKEEIG